MIWFQAYESIRNVLFHKLGNILLCYLMYYSDTKGHSDFYYSQHINRIPFAVFRLITYGAIMRQKRFIHVGYEKSFCV